MSVRCFSLWERVWVRANRAPIDSPAPHPSPLPRGAREQQPSHRQGLGSLSRLRERAGVRVTAPVF